MRHVALICVVALLSARGGVGETTLWGIPKGEGPLLVAMATCKTIACINTSYAKISKPEMVARIVYYTNLLRIDPKSQSASHGLLLNIPRTGRQNAHLIVLSTNMYPGETDGEISAVGQAYWNFNQNLAHALRLHPEFLPAFIRYGTVALTLQSTYPKWATRVCKLNPERFLRAFRTLRVKDQQYIAKYVMQPKGCKQIFYPEAE